MSELINSSEQDSGSELGRRSEHERVSSSKHQLKFTNETAIARIVLSSEQTCEVARRAGSNERANV